MLREFLIRRRYRALLSDHKVILPPDADPLRVYVIVDGHVLPSFHRALQGGHALLRMANVLHSYKNYQKWLQEDETLILLQASPSELIRIVETLNAAGKKVFPFAEPDLNDRITAVAVEPILKSEGLALLGHLKPA